MFGKLIETGVANLCAMCATPGWVDTVKNTAETGGSTQLCYTAYGSGTITSENSNTVYELTENTLTDISAFRKNPLIGTAGPNAAIWVSINPVYEKEIDYTFIQGQKTVSFTGEKSRSILLCLRGDILANGKPLKALQFATIVKDKQVEIEVPDNGTAIVFWLK